VKWIESRRGVEFVRFDRSVRGSREAPAYPGGSRPTPGDTPDPGGRAAAPRRDRPARRRRTTHGTTA